MAVAWFIGPYKRNDTMGHGQPTRVTFLHEAMEGQQRLPHRCVEIFGNYAACKVRAPENVLDQIAALPNVDRINKDVLDDPLTDLTPAQKQRLKDLALELGFTAQELQERFPGDLGNYTIGDVLRFFNHRWRRPFWNGTDIEFETVDSPPPATLDEIPVDEI